MKLYDFPFSPNSRKVRAVVYELGIALEFVRVDLFEGAQRALQFLARNPNGRVPVLEDGDFVLWESAAIMQYLARGSALVPSDARGAAEMQRWIAWQLAHLGPAMSKIAFERLVKRALKRGEPDPARIAEGTAEFIAMAAILDDALADREFVAGPLTLADFALAAHVGLAAACDLDLSRYRNVTTWLARMTARDSMRKALADAKAAQAPAR
jgi:glutathione S-transferase